MPKKHQTLPLPDWDSANEVELFRELCRRDFWTFFLYAFGAGENPKGKVWIDHDIHYPIARWLQHHINDWFSTRFAGRREQKHIALVIPRELGKTTITQAVMLWIQLRDPEASIYIGSERLDLSVKILGGCKAVLDGSDPYAMFSRLYGNWATASRSWTGREIVHAARKNTSRKDPSFGTFAVETSIVGAHPDVWVEDDPNSYERLTTDTNWLSTVNSQVSSMIPVVQADGLIIWPGCIALDTPVLLADGTWLPIQCVRVGDFVYTTDDTGEAAIRLVTASMDQGEAETVMVTLGTGSVRCTPWHPFLVAHAGELSWRRADALKPRDLVVAVKSSPCSPEHEWMTDDVAWLSGFILGDGWIGKNADYACIALSKDEALNERVLSILEDWIPDSLFHRTAFGYIRCNSTPAASAFRTLALSGGAKSKRAPRWVFKAEPRHRRAFLKGFCQADGHSKRGDDSWEVEISNADLIADLRLLAKTCGVRVGIDRRQRERMIKPPNSREPILSQTTSSSFNFATADRIERPPLKNAPRAYRQEIEAAQKIWPTFHLDRVRSVVASGRTRVWDLTVEGSRSFICNGFVVHNTRYDDGDHFGTAFVPVEEGGDGVASLSGMETDSIKVDPQGNWHVYWLSARDAEGKPTCPKVWPERRLQDYERRDPLRYASQVLNNPTESATNPITRDQIRQCVVKAESVPWSSLTYGICCDTAFNRPGSYSGKDWSVFVIHGYPRNGSGDVYVVECHGSPHWRAEDFGKRLVAKVQQYRQQGKRITALSDELHAGLGDVWQTALRNYFTDANEPMPMMYMWNRQKGANKTQRIKDASKFWVDGHVRVVENGPGVALLMEQMAKIGQFEVNPRLKKDFADAHADAFKPEFYQPMRRQSKQVAPWEQGATPLRGEGFDPRMFEDDELSRWRNENPREPLRQP